MKQGSLNVIELHIDKIVLGLAGAFTLAMVWMYMIGSPNVVEYGGQEVGPDELDEKILASARDLEAKVQRATSDSADPQDYSAALKSRFEAGVLGDSGADAAPALASSLRRTGTFGSPIVVPGLEEEQVREVRVVTPLRPDRPAVRTGRSLAYRLPNPLGADTAPSGAADEKAEPKTEEITWVSIAAYFPEKAQKNEMTTVGNYATYRAKVYFVGLDVDRQEMLASGEFSEWKHVEPGKAMPKIDAPDPAFDDETGAIVNKPDIDAAFDLVRANQAALLQPGFYTVEAGDDWLVPPIEGFEDTDEEEEEVDDDRRPPKNEGRGNVRRTTPPPSVRGGGGIGVAGGGRSVRGGGGGGFEGAPVSPPPQNTEAKQRREARKQIRENLRDANKAYREKDYQRARQLLDSVINHEYASSGDKSRAKRLLKAVEERLAREMGRRTGQEALPFITYPAEDRNDPAIWFHDDSVEPGKTYRYRIRARLWNRYVGRLKAVQDEESAKHAVLLGEWSLPTDPVTVTPSTHFFVRGKKIGSEDTASIDVWKWRDGYWLKQNFDVQAGDVIGGVKKVKVDDFDDDGRQIRADVDFTTGAVVLDLRVDQPVRARRATGKEGEFTYRDATSLIMVYLDPADGQVKEKSQIIDRYDPIKKELEDQEL